MIIKFPIPESWYPRKKFLDSVKKFHDALFLEYAKGRPVLINQGGSGWNPIEFTKYFSKRKVVVVTRDPRDQFVELKNSYKNANSVEGFVKWYKEMRIRIENTIDQDLLHLEFENFVNENTIVTEELCNHLSLDFNVKSKFDINYSKKISVNTKNF